MKYKKHFKEINCIGQLSHSDIIHDSVGFVVNNAIDKDNRDIYNATQGRWKCSLHKVKNVELVFSIYNTIIVEIWTPHKWAQSDIKDRVQWEGEKCNDEDIRNRYLYKKVPKSYSVVRYYGNMK